MYGYTYVQSMSGSQTLNQGRLFSSLSASIGMITAIFFFIKLLRSLVFKALVSAVVTRFRMLRSRHDVLQERIEKYATLPCLDGIGKRQRKNMALKTTIIRYNSQDRFKKKKKGNRKNSWDNTCVAWFPLESKIVEDNLPIFTLSCENAVRLPKEVDYFSRQKQKKIFVRIYKQRSRASSQHTDRYPSKDSTPARPQNGHVRPLRHRDLVCLPMGRIRTWKSCQSLTSLTENDINVFKCTEHPHNLYKGSTRNLMKRRANRKSDIKTEEDQQNVL